MFGSRWWSLPYFSRNPSWPSRGSNDRTFRPNSSMSWSRNSSVSGKWKPVSRNRIGRSGTCCEIKCSSGTLCDWKEEVAAAWSPKVFQVHWRTISTGAPSSSSRLCVMSTDPPFPMEPRAHCKKLTRVRLRCRSLLKAVHSNGTTPFAPVRARAQKCPRGSPDGFGDVRPWTADW